MTFEAQLTEVLADVFGSGTKLVSHHRGPVGNGQETWFCALATASGDRDVVVRRSAGVGPLQWTDRRSEYAALAWLSGKGLPTPTVWHFEPEGGRLDRSAIVMDRMSGGPFGRMDDSARDRLAIDLGRKLAQLHAIDVADWPGVVAGDLNEANESQLESWAGRYVTDALQPVPLLAALLGWLEANLPERSGRSVPLWGDAALYNSLNEDGTVTAMLDWELAHAGDPFEDLGAAVWATIGIADPELVIAGYREESGLEVIRDDLRWFEVFAATTRAIMLLRGARSLVEDPGPRPSFMSLALYLLPQLLLQAARSAGWQIPPPRRVEPQRDAAAALLRPTAPETLRGVAAYLQSDVLPAVEDPLIRRNLKNTVALLDASAARHGREGDLLARSDAADAALLADLEAAGIDVADGLGPTAAKIEADASLAPHRDRVRTHRSLLTGTASAPTCSEGSRRCHRSSSRSMTSTASGTSDEVCDPICDRRDGRHPATIRGGLDRDHGLAARRKVAAGCDRVSRSEPRPSR
jgi:aminoglycoside phosphotransferase (APT) family kinase protein